MDAPGHLGSMGGQRGREDGREAVVCMHPTELSLDEQFNKLNMT